MTTNTETISKRSLKDYAIVTLKGMCMGAADIVPGVSGGTMAFILGIYEELINAIKSVDFSVIKLTLTFKWKAVFARVPWQFLLSLFTGIMLAILLLAQGLEWTLENRPLFLWPFFFGLILASIWVVSKRIEKWTASKFAAAIIAGIAAFIIVGMVPRETPNAPWFIFLTGAIVICAMILPGISGSFIMVLMGKYEYILSAVNNRDIVTLLIFMAGAVVGLVTFARLLSWLFKNYHDVTIALLTGLLLGSLRKIWIETTLAIAGVSPESETVQAVNIFSSQYTQEIIIALVLAITGFVVVMVLENFASQKSSIHG